ncbi:hypothetical protein PSTG_05269 [Puccinia striiformis f. sp. tritici PST-78]|uniref:Uncharacterized protein n=1 Tax=Puccinia striiformis f. sp. tritici PST-78 TaxID=1165861 RepID=A0A0L0VQE8_9BASI|nr:hypothetical protein PSTG_05269 [Puccinia striiformis f. sp. tritici PST-78]
MPQNLNSPLSSPPLSRDPYKTPLTPFPPEFTPTWKITEERLKVVNFGPKDLLWEEEFKLFKHLIITRQDAFAFGPEERGLLKHTYGQPYVIPVIKHEPWQQKPIPIPTAIKDQFIELVRERIKTGLYEQSFSTYSSPGFCVKKQDDSGLPPNPEELIESFTGRACYGLGDIMGGYDERELAPESRPLTTFETRLGRFQLTRLPQGATNSVAVYQAQMMWILQDEIPNNKLVSSKRVPVDQTKSSNTEGMDPQEDGEEEEVGEINIHYSCPLGYVTLSVNGRSFQALLDNGSQVNLMS